MRWLSEHQAESARGASGKSSYVSNQEVRCFQSGETAAAAELVHWTILFVRSAMYRNGMKFSYGNTASAAGADDGSGDAPQQPARARS